MERSRHGSTAGQVRKAIRADIQTGVFPAGSRLTSEMLAERYRVSRTPVREALIRLEEDGLVCGTPNAGYELRQPTIAELCEIYELREALEGLAIERTIRTGVPPELLKELRQACELRRNSSVNGPSAGTAAPPRFAASSTTRCCSPPFSPWRRSCSGPTAAGPTASTKRSCRPWRTATRSARGGC